MDSILLLKNNLILRIKNSDDLKFLKALQTIFDSSEQALYELNEDQIKSIEHSKDEIKEGKYTENSESISNLKVWLKNQ
ncbi:MAG: hypothetical protein L3J35_03460 [Bacteroidales bacterium]|nr:hypothetical protein [Bacteroidales bacterium]